jgi:hypothetical protein
MTGSVKIPKNMSEEELREEIEDIIGIFSASTAVELILDIIKREKQTK